MKKKRKYSRIRLSSTNRQRLSTRATQLGISQTRLLNKVVDWGLKNLLDVKTDSIESVPTEEIRKHIDSTLYAKVGVVADYKGLSVNELISDWIEQWGNFEAELAESITEAAPSAELSNTDTVDTYIGEIERLQSYYRKEIDRLHRVIERQQHQLKISKISTIEHFQKRKRTAASFIKQNKCEITKS
ncbi:hypothetical protein IQ250_04575 [Pseudanabaenaceae cyanobacterium LEGE 13415]|nr:hypothetical protein [Pseudanabaenaceae cyanobacterium LEGE 13415]